MQKQDHESDSASGRTLKVRHCKAYRAASQNYGSSAFVGSIMQGYDRHLNLDWRKRAPTGGKGVPTEHSGLQGEPGRGTLYFPGAC